MIERRNISVTAMVFYKRKKYIEICVLDMHTKREWRSE